jgi:hypothetical protein
LHLTAKAPIPTIILAAITVALTVVLSWLQPPPTTTGLLGRYFATSDWSGEPILERVDTVLSTRTLAATRELAGRTTFSVEWTGSLVVRRDGIHSFATTSDDGTWMWIGDQLVIDNGGAHSAANVTGELRLRRGLYPFKVRYNQTGGDYFLQIGQTGQRGLMLHPAPLIADQTTYTRLRIRELWPLGVVVLWYGALLLVLVQVLRRFGGHLPLLREFAQVWSDRRLRVIVALGSMACAAHIVYGLPAVPSFSADELEPLDTLLASESGFRYWNLRWPLLHAFVITGVLQPFTWAEALFDLPLLDEFVTGIMFVVTRTLSVLLIASTLVLAFDGTRMIADRRAGYYAAALLASSPIVVFFGSLGNLDTPHLFWVTLTFWVWLKLVQHRSLHWFAVFGVAVGFSVASKDQAYGYYLAAPLLLVALVGHERGLRGPRAWIAAAIDRRLALAAAGALTAMAIGHGLPWGLERFVNRVAVITGPSSVPYRLFPPTLAGHVALFITTGKLLVWAAGLPLALSAAGGIVDLLRRGRGRLVLAALTPIGTYYVSFLAVILYAYDRFLIGWLPIAAFLGGVFLVRMERARLRGLATGQIVVFAVLATAITNAVAMNVVFFRDPRHGAWKWLRTHVPCGSSVGVTYGGTYTPPLDCYDIWQLEPGMVDSMIRWPRYLVLNEAYAQRFAVTPSGSSFLRRLHSGELGYQRVLRHESSPPLWAPLYWETRFRNSREDIETTSDKPLHAIEVWECAAARCRS